MLWNVAHISNKGSWFVFNRYCHWGKVFVRDKPGTLAIIIHSKEGLVQGCILSMNAYGVAMMLLVHDMRVAIPQAFQTWFADDTGAVGKAKHNAKCLEYLVIH